METIKKYKMMVGRFVILVMITCISSLNIFPQEVVKMDGLEKFIDNLMITQLDEYDIPGSVVVIVKDGEIILSKGYGYSDLENQLEVDPDNSMFRIASISKLFNYVATMKLVEEGKLSLETPIVDYLEPVGISTDGIDRNTKIKHLLTHSAGFEIPSTLYGRDEDDMLPLIDSVSEQFPAQIRPPGNLAGYSNFSVGLLGLIVEIVSGMTWEDYIEENILDPLDMKHTTGHQPVPSELFELLTKGYKLVGKEYLAQEFTYSILAPAGGMSASGLDMAKFMLAMLNDGKGIFKADTADFMQSTLFQHDSRLPGFAHGFFESQYGNQRTIGHSGTLPNFISHLWLLPDKEVGVFISYNSRKGMMAQYAFAKVFFEKYFPDNSVQDPVITLSEEELKSYTGTYRSTMINMSTNNKFDNLRQDLIIVKGEKTLELYTVVIPPMEVEPIGKDIFRDINTGEKVVITKRGGLGHVFIENWPDNAFTKIAWYETMFFHVLLLFGILLVFISVIITSVIYIYNHLRLKEKPNMFDFWVRTTSFAMSIIFATFIVIRFYYMIVGMSFGIPASLSFLSTILPLAVGLTFATIVFAFIAWKKQLWKFKVRIRYSLLAFVSLTFVGQLIYFNLLNF